MCICCYRTYSIGRRHTRHPHKLVVRPCRPSPVVACVCTMAIDSSSSTSSPLSSRCRRTHQHAYQWQQLDNRLDHFNSLDSAKRNKRRRREKKSPSRTSTEATYLLEKHLGTIRFFLHWCPVTWHGRESSERDTSASQMSLFTQTLEMKFDKRAGPVFASLPPPLSKWRCLLSWLRSTSGSKPSRKCSQRRPSLSWPTCRCKCAVQLSSSAAVVAVCPNNLKASFLGSSFAVDNKVSQNPWRLARVTTWDGPFSTKSDTQKTGGRIRWYSCRPIVLLSHRINNNKTKQSKWNQRHFKVEKWVF